MAAFPAKRRMPPLLVLSCLALLSCIHAQQASNASVPSTASSKGSTAVSNNSSAGTPTTTAGGTMAAKPVSAAAKKDKKVKIVDLAPAADVTELNDIEVTGACADAIKVLCPKVQPGDGSVADCLTANMLDMAILSAANRNTLTDDCQEEVLQYRISQNLNINANPKLAKACMDDALKYCNGSKHYEAGAVIACLRENKASLKANCRREVFKVQQAAALDFRVDTALYRACKADAERLCGHIKPGTGEIIPCLRDHASKLMWECKDEMYRQAEENADDLRLNLQLFKKCLPAKKKFCSDVTPGDAQAIHCLEQHRTDESFPAGCKEQLDVLLQLRVEEFRLDARLMRVCREDVADLCLELGSEAVYDEYSEFHSNCLQDSIRHIQSPDCRRMVHQYQALAAEDVRFNAPLAVACGEDRKKLCGGIPPGSARVMRCLEKQRDRLTPMCRAELFDQEQHFSENIDFQYPVKRACQKEMDSLCANIPHGEARVIRCLQDKSRDKAAKAKFSEGCRKEVEEYEHFVSQDYRLNYRLHTACQKDVAQLCRGVCNATEGQVCGGRILHCLTENSGVLSSKACKQEVFYFQKMEVTDYKNDVILAEACKGDVEKLCDSVQSGEGRIHACLREHREKLSPLCREEELGLEAQEAENIELRPRLLSACRDERDLFCSGVAPGSGRVFKCLAEHLGDADFGEACAAEMLTKLSRRQANWKLDPSLRKACRATVEDVCPGEDGKKGEAGEVIHCLVRHYQDLPDDQGCPKEVSRALYMALYVWQPGAILTRPCDADVEALCMKARPNVARTTGAVLKCLTDVFMDMQQADASQDRKQTTASVTSQAPRLSAECMPIMQAVRPHGAREEFETSLLVASLAASLQGLADTTGLKMVQYEINGEPRGFTLTGWSALLGVGALTILLAYAALALYRQYYHIPGDKDYTLVLKAAPSGSGSSGPAYTPVSTAPPTGKGKAKMPAGQWTFK